MSIPQRWEAFVFLYGGWRPSPPGEVHEGVAGGERHHVVPGMAGELSRSQPDRKLMESSEALAARRTRDFKRGDKKNREKSLEAGDAGIPRIALPKHAAADASSR